jgi:uncharacterized protein (DUF2236 family)
MITHRVNAERVVLLGWSRAILLQLAHPLVAAGVADHSAFRGGALAAALRLRHTVRAMLNLAFGDPATAEATLTGIRAIHRRVHGKLGTPVGPFAAGHRYSAEDPALLVWVHATLVESVVLVYERLVAPLSDAERDQYCAEAAPVAVALGARTDEVPRTWRALGDYVDRMHASGVIVVGPDARRLGQAILYPPLRVFTAPAGWINRSITRGVLPDRIRSQYSLTWTRGRRRQFHVVSRVLRLMRRLLPFGWAHWPEARAAARAASAMPPRPAGRLA